MDRLINLSIDNKTETHLRLEALYAILKFEDLNELQVKKISTLLINHNWAFKICAASVLANFRKTEDVGVDLLISFINRKPLWLRFPGISEIITQNKRLAFNSKFLEALYNSPSIHWETNICLTVIEMFKKVNK